MIVIDERSKVRGVAERWKSQYFHGGKWGSVICGDAGEIYAKLAALDPETAVAADVARTIGNNTWAGPDNCDECSEPVLRTVQIGQKPDYESSTALVCEDCLRHALALLRHAEQHSREDSK